MTKGIRSKSFGRLTLAIAIIFGPIALAGVTGARSDIEDVKLNAAYSKAAAVCAVMEKYVKAGLPGVAVAVHTEKEGWWAAGSLRNAADITVRMLLNHTSRVPEYMARPRYVSRVILHPLELLSMRENLSYIQNEAPLFVPVISGLSARTAEKPPEPVQFPSPLEITRYS